MKTKNHLLTKCAILSALSLVTLSATATSAFAQVFRAAPTVEIKFRNESGDQGYINIENGPLVVTTIKESAWSSRWYFEPTDMDGYYRLKNKWKGCYLNIEQGPLVCSAIKDSAWSARWSVIDKGEGQYIIENRWKKCLLNQKPDSSLSCNKAAALEPEFMWRPVRAQ